MRCLHLTLTTARGGRRDAILTLVGNLRTLGVTCGLVGLRDTADQVATLANQVDFHGGLHTGPRVGPRAVLQLWRLCRDHRVEVLHAHDAGSLTVASALRYLLPKLRIVMTFHRSLGLDTEGWRNRVRNWVTLPAVAKVITASEERRRYFLEQTTLAADRVEVIPHGVDQELFHPDPARREWVRKTLGLAQEELVVVAVGHFGPEKGLDQVVSAMAAAARRVPSLTPQLVILGTGTADQEAALRTQAVGVLGDRVTFLGFRDDVAAWLQGADLLVHAPRQEAFGLVTIQAMACGIPVVAAAVGGVPEIVVDGRSGLLIPPGDADALGGAIARLLGDDAERGHLAEGALALAREQFDARKSARRHVELYREVAG
jgi:glycosyltransferase involved in cell wall biosynthesis